MLGLIAKHSTGTFERRCGALAICLALALGSCAAPLVGAQEPAGSSAANITGITLERDCFGCPMGSILVLRRDGTATYTATGKVRRGTADRMSTGKVRVEDFEKLARLIVSKGFFELKEQYEDPQIQDGAWTTTSVEREGQDKRVFRRNDAGPPSLTTIEAAIEALKARIAFVPKLE